MNVATYQSVSGAGRNAVDELNGRAVGVCDDAAVLVVTDALGVDLGNHKRNIVVVTKPGGVVDDHAAGGNRFWRKLLRYGCTGRKQANIRL
ncbi:MAG: hypothetical protein MI919_38125 [Holophagales bacterium]|nr:hypothetical protein [Holophagales bacterium]